MPIAPDKQAMIEKVLRLSINGIINHWQTSSGASSFRLAMPMGLNRSFLETLMVEYALLGWLVEMVESCNYLLITPQCENR